MTEEFIEIWREKRNLWDIKTQIYAKLRSCVVFKEKLNVEGKYVLFTCLKKGKKVFWASKFTTCSEATHEMCSLNIYEPEILK